jgi:predicted RNase H-like HicB family nuclease
MVYHVALKRTEEGISVWVPGLHGCWSEGDTEAEALENIRHAIVEYLAAARDLAKQEAGTTDIREVEVMV